MLRPGQVSSVLLPHQASQVPMQAGTVPATTDTTNGINISELMNLMITMMIIVMMMKMMTGMMAGVTS